MPVKIKPATGAGSVSLEAQNAISTDYTLTLPGATGTVALTASPVFTTNITVPAVIGGTTSSSSLTLQSTSGVGTSDSILFKVGNNGATTAATIDTLGNFGIGLTPNTWQSGARSLQLGSGWANLTGNNNNGNFELAGNAYINSSGNWVFATPAGTFYAARYTLNTAAAGAHVWYASTAGGTAGNSITWSQLMTLDASGRLGVGETSPSTPLCVAFATNPATDNGAGSNTLRVYTTQTQAANVGGAISLGGQGVGAIVSFAQIAGRKDNSTSSDNTGYLQFATLNSGGTMAERMRILSTGNILCLSGGSTTATGTGIAFPATQSASSDANTLDDYEEGTWTPSFTNAGSPVLGYANYTKIGRVVTVQIRVLSGAAITANSSYFTLPFNTATSVFAAGVFTTSTSGGGFLEAQGGSPSCYFATTTASGTFIGTITYITET